MKKFWKIFFKVTICMVACIFAYYEKLEPAFHDNLNFTSSGGAPKEFTVPLNDGTFLDLQVDGACELQYTNENTIWQFDRITVLKTSTHKSGKHAEGEVYYTSNKEIFRYVGECYISVISEERLLAEAYQSLKENAAYEVNTLPLGGNSYSPDLWDDAESVNGTFKENNFIIPQEVSAIFQDASNVHSYYFNDDGSNFKADYLNIDYRFGKFSELKSEILKKAQVLGDSENYSWYEEENLFLLKSGDFCLGIIQMDYTSAYFFQARGTEGYRFMVHNMKKMVVE